nr:MAG TPA: hypothetical protein [Caudoviricetes sp.]
MRCAVTNHGKRYCIGSPPLVNTVNVLRLLTHYPTTNIISYLCKFVKLFSR